MSALGRVIAHRTAMLAAMSAGDLTSAREHAANGRAEAAAAGVAPFERELRGFEAAILDRAGCHQEAGALAAEAIAASTAADDVVTEIWARLVAAIIAMRTKQFDEARAQLELARSTSVAAQDVWWGGAMLRAEGYLRALDAGPETSWEASRPTFRRAVERAAGLGDLGELALSLRAAAEVAERVARPDIAAVLLDAVPATAEMTVLPSPFDDPAPRTTAHTARRPESGSIIVNLRGALDALGDAGDPEPHVASSSLVAELRRDGDIWLIAYKGHSVRIRDLKGLHDLAVLFGRTGQEIHCLELMGAAHVQESTGAVLDNRARKEYQDRIVDLQTEIDDAHTANDLARAERAEVELDALVQQLSEAFGITGRARGRGSSAERARTAVTYRIRAAIRRIADVHPDLARHLDNAVRTGTWCSYKPEVEVAWAVQRS